MSNFDNYEEILYEFLTRFVDKDKDYRPLLFRNVPPTEEEMKAIGDKVYCVYTVFEGDYGQQTSQPISIYSYGNRAKIHAKKEAIYDALQGAEVIIGKGIIVKFTSGSPFMQDSPDADENFKGYYINMISTIYKA